MKFTVIILCLFSITSWAEEEKATEQLAIDQDLRRKVLSLEETPVPSHTYPHGSYGPPAPEVIDPLSAPKLVPVNPTPKLVQVAPSNSTQSSPLTYEGWDFPVIRFLFGGAQRKPKINRSKKRPFRFRHPHRR